MVLASPRPWILTFLTIKIINECYIVDILLTSQFSLKLKLFHYLPPLMSSNMIYFKSQGKSCTPGYVVFELLTEEYQFSVFCMQQVALWSVMACILKLCWIHVTRMIMNDFCEFCPLTCFLMFFKVIMSLACHIHVFAWQGFRTRPRF